MTCRNSLEQDIKVLEGLFPKIHKVFQIIASSFDELTCRFISGDEEQYIMHANFTVTYPSTPPIWFAETEDSAVTDIVHNLANTSDSDNNIMKQIQILVHELCKIHNLQEPAEISHFQTILNERSRNADIVDSDYEYDEEVEDDMLDEIHENTSLVKTRDGGISDEYEDALIKLEKQNQWNSRFGQAKTRLFTDLREVCYSESLKEGVFNVELADLYEWNVRLLKVHPDSDLHFDLKCLTEKGGRDCILFNILFKGTYPFEPPFIRVVYPVIKCQDVISSGGAICVEFLTQQGWSSAYTVEAIILQIAATLVKGKARVQFDKSENQYSLYNAQVSYQFLLQEHEQSGWVTPLDEGG